ncbi:UNVERIFIED_CONTAM: hypothetical protein PYX00_000181 [Menopon gallinae]|uniref:Uncharacterized protein n=1 Tax=Menopon gallinae TaxID=328185 RepID=A0AAW2I7J3_9NEOP
MRQFGLGMIQFSRILEMLLYRQTRFSSRRVRKRVVFKHGDVNVVQGNVAKRRRKYLQDIFTTLVDAQWRWTLLVFSLNFLLSWLLFAVIWWLIAYSHGDLDAKNNEVVAAYLNETFENPHWVPCVIGINSFASCFLFSVETQHTIGYGGRSTSEECPEAIFVMCLQSIFGVMIQAFMVGIVFVKLSRPIKRTHTLLFSRNAVICQRDGTLCLMFRVGDMRKSHIIEAHVRAQLIRRKVTKEGELLPFHQEELQVGGDGEEDRIFFIWPTTIVHKIGPESPLYRLSAADMFRERFEIVVILEGIVESTGMTTQARSSYLPNEVLWGHRFEALIAFKKETGEYEVDYSLFNNTYEVETPLCSAYTLDQLMQINYSSRERSDTNGNENYQLGRGSSSEIIEGNSVDSRTFQDNGTRELEDSTIIEVDGDDNTKSKAQDSTARAIDLKKDDKLPESPETTPEKSCLEALERAIASETGRRHPKTARNLPPFKEELEEITCVNPSELPGPESRI